MITRTLRVCQTLSQVICYAEVRCKMLKNNIYYNNEITIQEIINNIKQNKNINYEIKKTNKTKIIKNKLNKKFIKLIKKEKNIKNKKIITII